MTRLETPRLLLRPLTGDDFDAFAAMMADPDVARHLSPGTPWPPDASWRNLALFMGHEAIRGYSNWALVERASGAFVGRAGPWRPHGWPGLEIGWCLAREHWGKGYATEAARAAVSYCFEELHADEVISLIAKENAPSIRVAERIGHTFQRETQVGGVPCYLYAQSAGPGQGNGLTVSGAG
ncbi:GNAT family N-acetyltransferase [Actinomadura roseirufa]|uniref:GNAT family N-acetyltransferase n=1 Tax=Actinomadura roseirufa TaxID=2094049 RepID=UPI001F5F3B64|nr:GNAT family N-acetyltransferase [Actinomadura roseirufa]